nr:carbohydrate sulfotransferase 12 isoform X2 [Parasteatoda tepidariorum]
MPPITRCRVYCFLFLMAVLTPFYIKLCRMQGNFNTEWRDQKFYDTENEQNRRKLLIDKTCQFLKINQTLEDIPSSYLDHFIVDDTHKLIYCFVPKVACTNWKRILLTLRKSKPMDPLTIAGNETHQFLQFYPVSFGSFHCPGRNRFLQDELSIMIFVECL